MKGILTIGLTSVMISTVMITSQSAAADVCEGGGVTQRGRIITRVHRCFSGASAAPASAVVVQQAPAMMATPYVYPATAYPSFTPYAAPSYAFPTYSMAAPSFAQPTYLVPAAAAPAAATPAATPPATPAAAPPSCSGASKDEVQGLRNDINSIRGDVALLAELVKQMNNNRACGQAGGAASEPTGPRTNRRGNGEPVKVPVAVEPAPEPVQTETKEEAAQAEGK